MMSDEEYARTYPGHVMVPEYMRPEGETGPEPIIWRWPDQYRYWHEGGYEFQEDQWWWTTVVLPRPLTYSAKQS